jgi:hypothetical protein
MHIFEVCYGDYLLRSWDWDCGELMGPDLLKGTIKSITLSWCRDRLPVKRTDYSQVSHTKIAHHYHICVPRR